MWTYYSTIYENSANRFLPLMDPNGAKDYSVLALLTTMCDAMWYVLGIKGHMQIPVSIISSSKQLSGWQLVQSESHMDL